MLNPRRGVVMKSGICFGDYFYRVITPCSRCSFRFTAFDATADERELVLMYDLIIDQITGDAR